MKTPKKKNYPRPTYQRSRRLQERWSKSKFSMYENKTPTETIDNTYHRESIIHSLMTEAPRCRICDRLPTTLGDFIYSHFQSLYKCEICFSIFPHFLTQDSQHKTWIPYLKRKNKKSK